LASSLALTKLGKEGGGSLRLRKTANCIFMPKKKPKDGKPEVHKDLQGFNIRINEFGEIITNFEIDKLNEFLDENLSDKKLPERADQDSAAEEEE
jgi:hypothetical protein